jgi:hypothetical protein
LGYLLKAIGPVRLPGGDEIASDDAAVKLLSDVYTRYPTLQENEVRDRYLQTTAGAVFARFLSGQGDPRRLADGLARAARDRRLLVYSSSPEEQDTLAHTSLAGEVPDTAAPLLGVVVNSGVASKLDYYLRRSVSWTSGECGADGQVNKVVVTLTNTAPRSGLPEYVAPPPGSNGGPAELATMPRGTDFLLVNILTTRGSLLRRATVDDRTATAVVGAERGHPVYGFELSIRPGQTRTLSLELLTPQPSHGQAIVVEQPLAAATEPAAVSLTAC